jgi:hypothetical protein
MLNITQGLFAEEKDCPMLPESSLHTAEKSRERRFE